MALPGVSVAAKDGGLGIVPQPDAGYSAKVGIGSLLDAEEIVLLSNSLEVATKVGTGPLAEACLDAFANKSGPIVAVGAGTGTPGEIESALPTIQGSNSFSATGVPTARFHIRIVITAEGALGEATFKWSVNGGLDYSDDVAVQAQPDNTFEVPGTGITIDFIEGGAGTPFYEGDQFDVITAPPLMSVLTATEAIEAALQSVYPWEFCHVVGASDSSFWTVCKQKAEAAALANRWVHFVCEATWPGVNADLWISSLLTQASGFQSDRVSVVAGYLNLVDLTTGTLIQRNGAGVYTGRLASVPLQRSPGRVLDGPVNAVSLHPSLTEAQIEQLDAAGFVTFRTFANTDAAKGVYVTLGRLMAASTSDFQLVQNRRVMDRALWLVREAALPYLQDEADAAPDANPASLARFEAVLQSALNSMVNSRQITAGTVTIPAGQDLLATQQLQVEVKIQPRGYLNFITAELGFDNPVQ